MTARRARAAVAAALALGLAATGLAGCTAPGRSGVAAPAARTPVTRTAVATPAAAVATTAPATSVPTTVPTTTAAPAPNPCAANRYAQLVRVSVRHQRLWMCAHHTLVRATPVTTGIVGQYTSTPTGDYVVQALDRHSTLTLISGQQYVVDYWIPFDGPLFGFHDSPWQTFAYGSARYRTEGSHGCVHMPHAAIAFLYHWAQVGAHVHIA